MKSDLGREAPQPWRQSPTPRAAARQALQGIASVIGPVIFGMTFAWSVRHEGALHQPGLAIYLAAALLVAALLLSLRVGRVPKAAAAGA